MFITCDRKKYYIEEITSKLYKQYLKIHEKRNKILTLEELNDIYNIVSIFFDIKTKELDKIEVNEIYSIYLFITLHVENKIISAINKVGNKDEEIIEYKGSVFDDLDEDNVEIEEENRWTYYLESLNYIFKYAITSCRNNIKDCLDMNIIDLIDYVEFDIEYNEEHKDDNIGNKNVNED